jgi:hypothetical protein
MKSSNASAMMSGLSGDAKSSPPCLARDEYPALAVCANAVAADAALAARLAAIELPDAFLAALHEFTRQRGLALGKAEIEVVLGHRSVTIGERLSDWPPAARFGWQPFALEFGPLGAELVWGCGTMPDVPFHEISVIAMRSRRFNRLFAVRTPLTPVFAASLQATALPVRGLIFHMSRCGSTLLAQALKAWRGVRVLSEPALLDQAITFALSGADPDWALFHAVLAALAQPAAQDHCVAIKLDAWHALALAQICAHIAAPWLFVYREPLEVLVSHRAEPGRHTVPGALPEGWLAAPIDAADPLAMQQHSARVIGAICAAVVPHAKPDQLMNYSEFPDALRSRLPGWFGCDLGAADAQQILELLAHHSKRPYEPYHDDRSAKRQAVDAQMRAAAERWITPHYAALERIRVAPEAGTPPSSPIA